MKENEALRAQIQKMKKAAENLPRSIKDKKLIENLRRKVNDYGFDLNKVEGELSRDWRQLAKSVEERVRILEQLKKGNGNESAGLKHRVIIAESKMAKQAKDFKAERGHCNVVIAGLERGLTHIQKLNQAVERTLEEQAEQIGRVLQEKGIIREKVRSIAYYITTKCNQCEDMTKSMFFVGAMSFVRQVMEDLHYLQGSLACKPIRPNDAPLAPKAFEALMYSSIYIFAEKEKERVCLLFFQVFKVLDPCLVVALSRSY